MTDCTPHASRSQLRPDVPLDDPSADTLDRASLATMIARNISGLPGDSPFVVGIQGPWGSGKSTVLNFIRKELQDLQQSNALILEFNPWWFTGAQDLALQFFVQLETQLRTPTASAVILSIADKLAAISSTGKWMALVPGIGELAKQGAEGTEKVAGKIQELLQQNQQNVVARRAELEGHPQEE